MANSNTNVLVGITFDQSQLGTLASPLELAQSRASGNPFISTTWTPLQKGVRLNLTKDWCVRGAITLKN